MKKLIEKLERDLETFVANTDKYIKSAHADIAALKAAVKQGGGTAAFDSPPDPEPDGPGTGGGH